MTLDNPIILALVFYAFGIIFGVGCTGIYYDYKYRNYQPRDAKTGRMKGRG